MSKTKLRKFKRGANNMILKPERKQIMERFCELYGTGEYTFDSCASEAGTGGTVIRDWVKDFEVLKEKCEKEGTEIPEKHAWFGYYVELFYESKKKARRKFREGLIKKAENALEKRISGFDYEETITEVKEVRDKDGNKSYIPVSIKKMKKKALPCVNAAKFLLGSLKPDVYGKQNIDITSKGEQVGSFTDFIKKFGANDGSEGDTATDEEIQDVEG